MVLAGNFDKFADPIGIGKPASLVLMTFAEFFCSLAVVFGFATRLAAFAVVIGMAVAVIFVHTHDPWTMGEGARLFMAGAAKSWSSKEPALLYLIPFFALIFTGAGIFSVDALIGSRRKRK